ncbi:hypothetical protein Tco_1318119 [Tanacetum coccineum]
MTTRHAGRGGARGGATPRGERTDTRRGRGGGRGNADDGNIGNNDGIDNASGNLDIAAMITQHLQDLLPTIEERKQGNPRDGDNNNNGNECSYKEFLACQPKEFDSKGGTITYTRWVEKMESVFDMSNSTEPTTIQRMILKAEGLTDDAVRNGLLKRSSEKMKESGETSKQEDARSNNKRANTGKGFIVTDSCKKEYKGLHPKCTKGVFG